MVSPKNQNGGKISKLSINSSLSCDILLAKTVRTVKPNVNHLLEPIKTETESCLKFKTETEEFWNRTSSNV